MKVLWCSNAPFVGSGYGVQTDLFTRMMVEEGHEVIVQAWYGHHGPPMTVRGVTVLPASFEEWSNDVLVAHQHHYKPDIMVILGDAWVFNPDVLEKIQPVFWAPIDHQTVPPLVRQHLMSVKHPWSMSRHGDTAMKAAGLRPTYVPHGVDTDAYTPIDRAAARKQWGIPEGAFLAVSVAANRGWPARKSLDRVLKAWARFVQTRPDAILYLHTMPNTGDGINLEKVAQAYNIPRQNLRFPDLYWMARHEYSTHIMNDLYNAADVFVLPSAGEGFGVPAIEAQAAGCPVILADATAQTELCGAGWLVEVSPFDDMGITLQYAEQANVRPSKILAALEKAYEARGGWLLRNEARHFGLKYDYRTVWDEYMSPALEEAAQINAARGARRDNRIEMAREVIS